MKALTSLAEIKSYSLTPLLEIKEVATNVLEVNCSTLLSS